MNSKKLSQWMFVLIVTMLLLDGCGGNASDQTSKVLTTKQINNINLESEIINTGDLPSKYEYSKPTSTVPERFKDLPKAQYQISIEITEQGSWEGNTAIFLYVNSKDIDKAFNPTGKAYDEKNALNGLGEKSSFSMLSVPYGTGATTLDLLHKCAIIGT